jgi:hypothetical protein
MLGRRQTGVTKPKRMPLADFSRTFLSAGPTKPADQEHPPPKRFAADVVAAMSNPAPGPNDAERTFLIEQSPQPTAHLGFDISRRRV